MATHSSVLAWRIPGTGEPGELPSMGWHRVGHEWINIAVYMYKHFKIMYLHWYVQICIQTHTVCVYIYIYTHTHIFNCTWTSSGIFSKICFTLRHKTSLSILHNTKYVLWKQRFEAKILKWDMCLQNCPCVKIIQDIPKEPIFQRVSHKGNYRLLWRECKGKHF